MASLEQARKHGLSVAGEELVKQKLNSLGILSVLARPGQKDYDIISRNPKHLDVIAYFQVKTTDKVEWSMGKMPPNTDQVWFFVYLSMADRQVTPEVYIMTGAEAREHMRQDDLDYGAGYRKRNPTKPRSNVGVTHLRRLDKGKWPRHDIAKHLDRWDLAKQAVKMT